MYCLSRCHTYKISYMPELRIEDFIGERSGACKKHPGTPRNTPGTPWYIPGTPPEQPGTPLEHPIIPRNTLETARNTPRTPKIVVSGQTAHKLTKPKTSEDSQFLIRLLRITLRFPSISRMLRNIFKAFKNSEKTIN